ncbi:retrovirus-related pol polyprotein from transposon TNT 1-94 [Tanacetum coccineum]
MIRLHMNCSDCKLELKYLYIFGALCYPTNDFEDLGKLQPKTDIGIFISYLPSKKVYGNYNKRTRQIMETRNVQFDELTKMASEQHGSGPDLQGLTSGHINTARASSSTTIDQKSPSPSTSPNIEAIISLINSTNIKRNEEAAEFHSDTFTNPFAPPAPAQLTKEEPKNYKEAMKESGWIEAMQEEIYEFERLEE